MEFSQWRKSEKMGEIVSFQLRSPTFMFKAGLMSRYLSLLASLFMNWKWDIRSTTLYVLCSSLARVLHNWEGGKEKMARGIRLI